jgi:hypothetical protein
VSKYFQMEVFLIDYFQMELFLIDEKCLTISCWAHILTISEWQCLTISTPPPGPPDAIGRITLFGLICTVFLEDASLFL